MCFIGFGDLGCQFYDVKQSKYEKSIIKTTNNLQMFDVSEIGFSFSLFFMPKRRKNEPIPGSKGIPRIQGDPADPADPVHGLPLGTSPTRAGGQDDVSSQANSLK